MYMESEEMALMNLFSGQQWSNKHGEQDGKEVWEGGDIGVPMADSC